MNRYFSLLLCVFLCVALIIAPATAQSEKIIKIGILSSSIPGGKGIRQASEMAAEEINSKGGILGKKIELIFSDTKAKPEIGAYEYTRLAKQEKVAAVLGPASSEVALAVAEHMAHYKTPFLITGAGTPKTTEQVKKNYDKYKYLFKVYHNSYELADFSTDWIINSLVKNHNLKRVALMIESAVWTRPVAKKWEKSLRHAGAEIPVFEYFDKNTKDFTPILSKIINSKAEAICVASANMDPAAYVTLWADMEGPIMGGVIGMFTTLWENAGDKSASIISMAYPGVVALTSKDKPFFAKYLKKYDSRPEYTSPYTYDAMYILKEAVERAKSEEPDALVVALENTDYTGVMGRWVYNKESHHSKFGPGYRHFIMVQWQAPGKLCVFWPENRKNCDFILPPWYKK